VQLTLLTPSVVDPVDTVDTPAVDNVDSMCSWRCWNSVQVTLLTLLTYYAVDTVDTVETVQLTRLTLLIPSFVANIDTLCSWLLTPAHLPLLTLLTPCAIDTVDRSLAKPGGGEVSPRRRSLSGVSAPNHSPTLSLGRLAFQSPRGPQWHCRYSSVQ